MNSINKNFSLINILKFFGRIITCYLISYISLNFVFIPNMVDRSDDYPFLHPATHFLSGAVGLGISNSFVGVFSFFVSILTLACIFWFFYGLDRFVRAKNYWSKIGFFVLFSLISNALTIFSFIVLYAF